MKFLAEVLLGVVAALLVFGAILLLEGCGGAAFEAAVEVDADAGIDADADDAGFYLPPPPPPPSIDAAPADADAPVDAAAQDACPAHYDGFGDAFSSCDVGVVLAKEACAAGAIGDATQTVCANADTSPCADRASAYVMTAEAGGGCREWVYAGPLKGQAFASEGACACPAGIGVAWW